MKKIVATVAITGMAVLGVVGSAAGATDRGVKPATVVGNPTCKDIAGLTYSVEVKFAAPVNCATALGVHIFVDGNTVGWYVLPDIPGETPHILVMRVIVKGGPNANVYTYGAVAGNPDFSDGGLVPPTNPKTKQPYPLGSVTFCY
jgi:hypothetical protein